MATFRSFEDLKVWQTARKLTFEIYKASSLGPFSKDFGLHDQIRRSSVSVMSNIAEGFERDGTREFVQFLAIAKGSVGEVRSQLYVAEDQGYLNKETLDSLFGLAIQTSRMIRGLMNYLRKTQIEGAK